MKIMKIMKKIITIALAASFTLAVPVSISAYPALPVLTVEEATRRAIRNNTAITDAHDRESVADESIRRAQEGRQNAITSAQITDANVALMNAELSRSLNIRDIQARQQNVEFQITRYFNSILNLQADLELATRNLSMANRELQITRLKLSLGMVSDLEHEASMLAVTRIENNIELLGSSIDRHFRDLNSSMGENASNLSRRHALQLTLVYEPVHVVNIDRHMQTFVNESLAVAREENAAQAARYRAENHATEHHPLTGEIATATAITYEERVVTQNQALRAVEDARQSVREGVLTSYNNLRDLELNIRSDEIELAQARRQLEVTEAMLGLGRSTQVEVDRQRLDIARRENSLQQARNNHSISRIAFNNPNILTTPGGA